MHLVQIALSHIFFFFFYSQCLLSLNSHILSFVVSGVAGTKRKNNGCVLSNYGCWVGKDAKYNDKPRFPRLTQLQQTLADVEYCNRLNKLVMRQWSNNLVTCVKRRNARLRIDYY